MPNAKINDSELFAKLTEVFREYGYEGASLSLLSERTGLKRASLYHRFPGGKEEMADAVLGRIDEHFADVVLTPLSGDGDPAARVAAMVKQLNAFYEKGQAACMLDALSRRDATAELIEHVNATFDFWLNAMIKVAKDAGLSASQARRAAEEAMVQIHGSLVVARASGNTGPFKRAMAALPGLLTEKE